MRVFMTGTTGYIGSSVARELKRRGHVVIGLARSESAAAMLTRDGIRPVPGDIEDADRLQAYVDDADAVVHCGFAAGAQGPRVDSAALDAILGALRTKHHAFVYTSGVWVYGSRGDAVVSEDAPLAPTPLVTWRPAHERRVFATPVERVRTVVIRPGIVYGDGGGIIGGMVNEARSAPPRVVGDGANHWSCVRVDALAELYALALERAPRGSIYNATAGAAVPYVEIARAASRAAGANGTVEHVPLDAARATMGAFADALALDLRVSSERAARELGWVPHRPTVLEELSATTVV